MVEPIKTVITAPEITAMTLGLTHWLRLLSSVFVPGRVSGAELPQLDLTRLSARDIADLNLPPGLAARREAEDLRRRVFD